MGTDVHMIIQAKDESGKYHDIPHNYGCERHYFLFGWIGNVRNGTGFAGAKLGDPIEPLQDRRGLPEDFDISVDSSEHSLAAGEHHPVSSKEFLPKWEQKYWDEEDEKSKFCWMGDHSYGWLTSTEILDAPLPQTFHSGIITLEDYYQWDKKSYPERVCSGKSGPNVKVAESPSEIAEDTTDVRVEWPSDSAEELGYFINEVKRLHKRHGEVRLVFGFDS